MKLMPGTTLIAAREGITLEREHLLRVMRPCGRRSILRACTRLVVTYGRDRTTTLLDAMLQRVQHDQQRTISVAHAEACLCLAAKLSRHAALSSEQVQGIINRKIDAMIALPIVKGAAHV